MHGATKGLSAGTTSARIDTYTQRMPLPSRVRFALVAIILVALFSSMAFAATAAYHGNIDSKIFHASACRYYDCKHCTAEFKTRKEAIDAGYRPCKICEP